MRTFRFIILSIAIVLTLGSSVGAQAEVDENDLHVMHPNLWERDINQSCPEGSIKTFMAVLSVRRGQRIREADVFVLHLKSGDTLGADGQQLDRRHVEYHLYASGRRAKVDLFDTRFTLLYGAITDYEYKLHVSSDCIEAGQ